MAAAVSGSTHVMKWTPSKLPNSSSPSLALPCGAAPREKCELHSGQPRTAPHRYRRLEAAEKQKAKLYELLASGR
jgi:hypothetical protein